MTQNYQDPLNDATPERLAAAEAAQATLRMLLEELKMVEEGWAVRERGHGLRLNPWEKERLMFIRDAIARVSPQAQ